MPYVDRNTYATNPGLLKISPDKWKYIAKICKLNFFGKIRMNSKKARVAEYIALGDTNPAIVISLSPLLIAAYSEDMDAVVMLEFPSELVKKYNLNRYDKLTTINVYDTYGFIAGDIHVGPKYSKYWVNFTPTIGEFLSDNYDVFNDYKNNFSEEKWNYIKELSEEYVSKASDLKSILRRKGFWFAV